MIVKKLIYGLMRHKITILVFVAIAIILANAAFIHSAAIGSAASLVYLVLLGSLLGRVLLSHEEGFVKLALGIFLVICFMIFVATPISIFYSINVPGLAIILLSPLFFAIFFRWRWGKQGQNETRTESSPDVPYFSPAYIAYLVLFGYTFFLLFSARSGWVYGIVWVAVSPNFFIFYSLLAFILIGIIFYSRTRVVSKILLVLTFSIISTSVFAIVLYPGNYGDPFDHMGWARLIVDYGNLRVLPPYQLNLWFIYWLTKEKGLSLIVAIIAKMFAVDVYWIHTFLTPVLWGVFIPLSAYKITRMLGETENISAFAALLATFGLNLLGWGSRSTGNSLGFVPFFVSLYFSVYYLKESKSFWIFLMAAFTGLISYLIHPLTGMMALILLFLAISLKRFEFLKRKSRWPTRFGLLASFAVCVFAIPALFFLNSLVYVFLLPSRAAEEAGTAFSLTKLLQTDPWSLIFGNLVSLSFKDVVLWAFLPLFGIIGFAYALKRKESASNTKLLVVFLALGFGITLIEYRLMEYAMVEVLFGPGRIMTFRDLIAVPFAAIAIGAVSRFFEGVSSGSVASIFTFRSWKPKVAGRYILTWVLIGLSISAFASSSLHKSYAWLGGLQPTALEVEAVKFIDSHAPGRYVVITNPDTALVGEGFAGTWNVRKWYEGPQDLRPSVAPMFDLMKRFQSVAGYYILTSWTPNFIRYFAEASRIFGLLHVLSDENAKIYIFQYKVAPLPPNYPTSDANADVMAFYWDAPTGYYVQNGLMRVVFNNVTHTLDVVDFYGDLYESMDLNKTLVGGQPLGKFLTVEYYIPTNDTWIAWNARVPVPFTDIPALAQSFSFKLRFERVSLVGVLERGKPSVRLQWDGELSSTLYLETGNFNRLYIPGLVGGAYSYNVSSREFGLLYLFSQTKDVLLRPLRRSEAYNPSLIFSEISQYGNLNITEGYLSFDVFIRNSGAEGQWATLELWLPDKIYQGTPPPMSYSVDGGKTWSGSLVYTDFPRGIPIRTLHGEEVNWGFTTPSSMTEPAEPWRYFTNALGGTPIFPANYTFSGGAQNRLLYGVYLPSGDEVLLRLGFSVYYVRPLKMTYMFSDSDNPAYGLRNMKASWVITYNNGPSEYVGGLNLTSTPVSLGISEDETGRISSMQVGIQPNDVFALVAMKGIDTATDSNANGIPDSIQR